MYFHICQVNAIPAAEASCTILQSMSEAYPYKTNMVCLPSLSRMGI